MHNQMYKYRLKNTINKWKETDQKGFDSFVKSGLKNRFDFIEIAESIEPPAIKNHENDVIVDISKPKAKKKGKK